MNPRLTDIDPAEALRYLGCTDAPPEALRRDLDRCRARLLDCARPRLVWRSFPRLADGRLEGTDWTPAGADIAAHLRGCPHVVVLAATLGAETETLIRRAQRRDMAQALLLDACAAAAMEQVCDNFCADLAAASAPARLTARYSPGYGDFPLSEQRHIFALLDVTRRIGVSLTEGGLMLPQKSVTALIGLGAPEGARTATSCDTCPARAHCMFRKEGRSCGTP